MEDRSSRRVRTLVTQMAWSSPDWLPDAEAEGWRGNP